jgi:fructokinase
MLQGREKALAGVSLFPTFIIFYSFRANKRTLVETAFAHFNRIETTEKMDMERTVDAVCFGEVLWDRLPTGEKPGGAPMNVAYHLQKQGLQTVMISRIGNDERGDKLLSLLEQNGLSTTYVQRDETHQTGIVNATLHESNEVSYEIVHPVAWDFILPEKALPDLVREAQFFIYGSLAARDKTTAATLWQLVENAQTRVVDINLRPPHFTKETVEKLLASAHIAKLNEHELPLIARWYGSAGNDEEQVKALQDRFSIPTLIVTKGGEGAMVCYEGTIFRHPGYRVKVADTIGSGDAFLAGFLAKTKEGKSIDERLQFANALGAFIAAREGACPPYTTDEVLAFIKS